MAVTAAGLASVVDGSDSCGVGSRQGVRKRPGIAGIDTDNPTLVLLSLCSSEYQDDDTAANETKTTADAEHVFGLDQQSERRPWFERCKDDGT